MHDRFRWFLPFAALLLLAGSGRAADPDAKGLDLFESKIRPVFVKHCQSCHAVDAKKLKGGLRLDTRDGLMKGGDSGPAVVPGDPAKSLLIRALKGDGVERMPPDKPLPAATIADFERWVKLGAPDPRTGADATGGIDIEAGKRHWAFQPIRRPSVPELRIPHSALRTPIDTFILAKLSDNGLSLSPPADRRTLVRRAYFDLTGLPPTPEEMAAFLKDTSPEAYPKLIDRLLASPHHGEKWGRHWLDVVRYADTAGETADFPVPSAWRYRNYVIDCFNADVPFDRFVREQIAGDILARSAPREDYARLVTATGYLAISRRFGYDVLADHYLTIEDTIDTLGKSLLGLTVGCARCHDHKYDPIPNTDYYALYGIFESTRYAQPGCEKEKRQRDTVTLVPLAVPAALGGFAAGDLAYAVAEGDPHDAELHRRGDPTNRGAAVPRRWLSVLGGQPVPKNGGSGRLALAAWLTDPANPLVARVVVNRVWQYHFGRGLVDTPNDFGARGSRPSHPELLDYLAAEFVKHGWSVKWLHRQIMLSATYQQASGVRSSERGVRNEDKANGPTGWFSTPRSELRAPRSEDPENKWLSRFARRRLTAEEIRDTILAVTGDLDRTPGGPHPFPDEKTWGYTQHNPFAAVYDHDKRSVYLMTQRIKRHPFLGLFDGADPNSSTPRRDVTTVPTQALYFLNDPFVHAKSARLAERLLALPDAEARLKRLSLLAYGRPPTADEVQVAARFLASYGQPGDKDRDRKALAAWARVVFASNEFLYVD